MSVFSFSINDTKRVGTLTFAFFSIVSYTKHNNLLIFNYFIRKKSIAEGARAEKSRVYLSFKIGQSVFYRSTHP